MDGLNIIDLMWNSSYFVLDLKGNNDIELDQDKNEFSDKTPRPSKALADTKLYKQLLDTKEKIPNCVNWEKWSKLVNPYEKVQSLAKYKNTKDYYKFFEIFKYYKITKSDNYKSSIHTGESSLNSVKALTYFLPQIDWYASINKTTNNNKSQTDLNKVLESELEDSKDDNGYSRVYYLDLDSENPLDSFEENLSEDFRGDIIIGDSTIETGYDPDNQEQLTFHNLFIQIVFALRNQSKNGVYIIKIYDTITRPTCQLIYYLTKFYENVSIIKPRTSKYTNSEKFIVAKKFIGISSEELTLLEDILDIWKPEQFLRMLGIEIPDEIEKQFFAYNKFLIENQYNYINKAIRCSYNQEEIPEKQLEAFQNKNAITHCSNFGIHINLIDTDISACKHIKKKKIQIESLKNTMLCEKCLCFITGNYAKQ
jgi:23S rRNA U2552 (ribose-2'-O)-methylase RlmE/FtsJ